MPLLDKKYENAVGAITAFENFIRMKEGIYRHLQHVGYDEQTAYGYTKDICTARFPTSLDAALIKYLQEYLRTRHGLDEVGPKSIVRAYFRLNLLTEEQTEHMLTMIDARNRAAHLYEEEVTDIVLKFSESHAQLMRHCLDACKP